MVLDTLQLITLVPDNVGYIMLLMPVARTDLMNQTVSGTNMIKQRMYEIILYYLVGKKLGKALTLILHRTKQGKSIDTDYA